ncbi:hypothetical protein TL16_g04137 [Triparma laevis f. inornata]|uniref:Uncharacterized protein n=1 Tax=Triparma laevis f. inornata TaxID=1714386 RepID=A0A9W7A7Z7_9STRA|nr:hypothetical protein TL16_g04137 [Triparma laevis f. inornata]
MFGIGASLNEEHFGLDQNHALTPEELAELEAELEADLDASDSDSDDHEWDALKQKLKTALHESEPTQQSDHALSNLAGFEQYSKSSTAMVTQMEQYTSDLTAMQETTNNAAKSMLTSRTSREINTEGQPGEEEQEKLLSMADVFELALGAATRGVVAYLLSETEARHNKDVEIEKAKQLEEVKKAQAAREEEINRQNESRNKKEEEKSKAVEALRAQQKAKEEEHRNKMKQQMLELENSAHSEMVANKKALEEKRRRNKQQRVAIMEAEERRWNLASKAVGFVQSRLRGLMGRKTAGKRKKQREQAKEENQRDGSEKLFELFYRHFSRLAFLSWKMQVKERVKLEQKAAVKMQTTARKKIGLLMVVALKTKIRNNKAAIKLQKRGRSFLARKVLGDKKTAKAVADEQQRAREEAARKFQEEQRRKEAEERKRQQERRRVEEEQKALAEMKAKEERRRRELEEQAKARRDAERIIDANLFGSEIVLGQRGGFGMEAILVEREDRKRRAVASLKATVEGFNLPPQRHSNNPNLEHTPHPRSLSSSAQQIEEDMLYGLGSYGSLQNLKLDVEHIEDASNLERLGVTALTSLSLNVNNLSSLQTIGMLKKLERLSLRDNKLTSLEGMKKLQSLVELMVDVNQLTSLETLSSSCWFNLTTLSANTNRISSLPRNLSAHLPCLSMLNLYQNNLESIAPTVFQNLPSLTSLDLGRNRLKDAEALGSALSLAPTLRKLVLSQNKMTAPPALTLPLLQQLWLSSNNISSLVAWKEDKRCYMPCLLELYLQENAIGELGGEGVLGFVAPLLDKLDLTFNSIESVGWSELCKKINTEAAKMRSAWRKKMASESRSVRQEAMVDHAEMLKDHLGVMVGDEGQECWGVVLNKAFEKMKEGGSGGGGGVGSSPSRLQVRRSSKMNTIISAAATMRIQCFIRRFLACQRVDDLRTVRIRDRGAQVIQMLYRGLKSRKKLSEFKQMKFDYVDDELDDMLGEDLEELGMEDIIGLGEEEGDGDGMAWKPTKPNSAVGAMGAVGVEDAWRTPSGTPNVPANNDDDMEIKSVTTVAESVPDTARSRADSRREQKEAELMKDWGLTDSRVAQAMMKRAKKMNKGKKAQAKKTKMKDALYRLEYAKRKGGGL